MGRDREDFADAVREAGRQSNTADIAAALAQTAEAVGKVSVDLNDEKLWRRRYAWLFIVVILFVLGVLGYLTKIAQDNHENGSQVRCTQDFIVDLVNPASELRAKLRADEPIVNPCR